MRSMRRVRSVRRVENGRRAVDLEDRPLGYAEESGVVAGGREEAAYK